MSTSETITKTDLKNILEAAGNIGQVDSTSTPTAGKVSEFDAAANINSTDMSTSELETFLENLDPYGSGGVKDVEVKGQSVVDSNGVATISLQNLGVHISLHLQMAMMEIFGSCIQLKENN